MSGLREAALLLVIASVAVAALVAFALLDRRSPNDHDPYFSDRSIPYVQQYYAAPDAVGRAAVLADHFMTGGPHPHLTNTVLVATLGTFGPTRVAYRLTVLPFLVLMVFGTWLLGREAGGPRVGLAAAALAVSLPVMVVYSRKFAPPWYAAAMAPLIWAMLLIALRRRGAVAWGVALGAGVLQGLRCYVHPITYPDIALSSALVVLLGIWTWRRTRAPGSGAAVVRVALAGGLALLLASHVLGFTAGWLGEPGYSLSNYLLAKGPNIGTSNESLVDRVRPSTLAVMAKFASEWWRMHAFPSGFVLLAVGVVAAARRALRGTDGRPVVALLAVAVLAQAPLAITGVRSGTFTSDWFLLVPPIAIVAAWGVFGPGEPTSRAAKAWTAVLVLHAGFVLGAPLLLGLSAPDPVDDRAWFERGLAGWFTETSSGLLWNTHHIPLRSGVAAEPLAEDLVAAQKNRVRVADLVRRGWDGSVPCTADVGDGAWVWGTPESSSPFRSWTPWPYFFHGLLLDGGEFTSARYEGGVPPTGRDQLSTDITNGDTEPLLVRLWLSADPELRRQWRVCGTVRATPALVDSAVQVIDRALPRHRPHRVYGDIGGELIGMEAEKDREIRYLSRAVLFLRF